MKTIVVSEDVWRRLQKLKVESGVKSLSKLIAELLDAYQHKPKIYKPSEIKSIVNQIMDLTLKLMDIVESMEES